MYLHFLLNAGIGAMELSGIGFLIAVAVFACLLGVEIAGILILSNKISRARRERRRSSIKARIPLSAIIAPFRSWRWEPSLRQPTWLFLFWQGLWRFSP